MDAAVPTFPSSPDAVSLNWTVPVDIISNALFSSTSLAASAERVTRGRIAFDADAKFR
jgi:hypothetical protein